MDGIPDDLIRSLHMAGLVTGDRAWGLMVFRNGESNDLGMKLADPCAVFRASRRQVGGSASGLYSDYGTGRFSKYLGNGGRGDRRHSGFLRRSSRTILGAPREFGRNMKTNGLCHDRFPPLVPI